MKKNLLTFITIAFLLSLTLFPSTTLAQSFGSMGELENEIKSQLEPIRNVYDPEYETSPESLAMIISEIIKAVLLLLGVVFLALIVYGGFIWLTSAGNEENITKAKKILTAAIIGVVIILSAYAITAFVIDRVLFATTGETIAD
jgi:hypothetical protein